MLYNMLMGVKVALILMAPFIFGFLIAAGIYLVVWLRLNINKEK